MGTLVIRKFQMPNRDPLRSRLGGANPLPVPFCVHGAAKTLDDRQEAVPRGLCVYGK